MSHSFVAAAAPAAADAANVAAAFACSLAMPSSKHLSSIASRERYQKSFPVTYKERYQKSFPVAYRERYQKSFPVTYKERSLLPTGNAIRNRSL